MATWYNIKSMPRVCRSLRKTQVHFVGSKCGADHTMWFGQIAFQCTDSTSAWNLSQAFRPPVRATVAEVPDPNTIHCVPWLWAKHGDSIYHPNCTFCCCFHLLARHKATVQSAEAETMTWTNRVILCTKKIFVPSPQLLAATIFTIFQEEFPRDLHNFSTDLEVLQPDHSISHFWVYEKFKSASTATL